MRMVGRSPTVQAFIKHHLPVKYLATLDYLVRLVKIINTHLLPIITTPIHAQDEKPFVII